MGKQTALVTLYKALSVYLNYSEQGNPLNQTGGQVADYMAEKVQKAIEELEGK